MTRRLLIANKTYSSWSMRPWLVMRAFGIRFDELVVPLDEPGTAEVIARHNPAGKVPVLVDGDLVIWDSLAIIEHLAETHPELPIWPRDAGARALARSLSAEMHSGFTPLRRYLPMNLRREPKPATLEADAASAVTANVARIESAWADARSRFGSGGPYLFGAFSAADAIFAPVVNRFHAYAVPVSEESAAYMATVMGSSPWRDWQATALAEGWRLPRIDNV